MLNVPVILVWCLVFLGGRLTKFWAELTNTHGLRILCVKTEPFNNIPSSFFVGLRWIFSASLITFPLRLVRWYFFVGPILLCFLFVTLWFWRWCQWCGTCFHLAWWSWCWRWPCPLILLHFFGRRLENRIFWVYPSSCLCIPTFFCVPELAWLERLSFEGDFGKHCIETDVLFYCGIFMEAILSTSRFIFLHHIFADQSLLVPLVLDQHTWQLTFFVFVMTLKPRLHYLITWSFTFFVNTLHFFVGFCWSLSLYLRFACIFPSGFGVDFDGFLLGKWKF